MVIQTYSINRNTDIRITNFHVQFPESMFLVQTPEDAPSQQIWIIEDKHYIEFALKACSNQMITLGETVYDSDHSSNEYMVILGGEDNTHCTITRWYNRCKEII